MSEILVADGARAWVELAARWIATCAERAIAERGCAAVALAGGSTPQPVHARLAELELDWPRVTFFFGDERCVPPDDPESNYAQAARALFDLLPAPGPRVVRMEGEDPDRASAARRYAERLPAALDLLILGLGEDGHTASLFPGAPALLEREAKVVPARGPKPPFDRLTITPPVIRAARRVLVLDQGASKAQATALALEVDGPASEVPARLAREGTWILDRAAAAGLQRPGG